MILFKLFSFSLGFISVGVLAGCGPKDFDVKPPYRNPYAQAKIERANVTGMDYLQYAGYRLAELKRMVELVAQSPAPSVRKDGTSCGGLVSDQVDGQRRLMRFKTHKCKVAEGLTASGEEVLDVQLDQAGRVLRFISSTVGPYAVNGRIKEGELKNSAIKANERRKLALDFVGSEGGDSALRYRFTYAVELSFSQELFTPSFKAFENDGQNQIQLNGELVLDSGKVQGMNLESGHLEVMSAREISDRKRRANGNTPNKTFHKVSLHFEGLSDDKGLFEPLIFQPSQCEMPQGKIRVISFNSSLSNDRVTKGKDKVIEFNPLGIRAEAIGKSEVWTDCRPSVEIGLPGGGKVTLPGHKPETKEGEIGNRNPYLAIFFK